MTSISHEAKVAITELIKRLREDDPLLSLPWPKSPAYRALIRENAHKGRLYVPANFWFHEVMLDAEGSVVVLSGEPESERAASAIEAHIVWQDSVAQAWPELATFVPSRPDDALTCEVCGGTGRPPYATGALANVMCACGNAGWIPADAVGQVGFDDWPPIGDPAPSRPTSRWQRLLKWLSRQV